MLPLPPPLPLWLRKDRVAVFGEHAGFPVSEVVGAVLGGSPGHGRARPRALWSSSPCPATEGVLLLLVSGDTVSVCLTA